MQPDTTPPTGSISINNGATSTGLGRVELTLSATDGQTGIWRMRLLNAGGAWGAWQSLDSPVIWDLVPGIGVRTVKVQYQNRALMTAIYSDSITVYACPPAGPLTNGNFSDPSGFPWCFTDESLNGFASFEGGHKTGDETKRSEP